MEKDQQRLNLGAESEIWLADEDADSINSKGTRSDLRDMIRMGKSQQLGRNFGFLSIVGFISVAMGTWAPLIQTNPAGLADGGMANLIWTYVVVFMCWCCVVASMAEMASMAPTSGGQYHWTAEFAPPRVARLLSYVVGWSCIFAWQVAFFGNASGLSDVIQDVLALSGSPFTFTTWQTYGLVLVTMVLCVVLNANIGNTLPLFGGALTLLYICGFFAILIPLLVLSPRTEMERVFLTFSNQGDPAGLVRSLIFGIFTPLITLMAPDVAAHMSEEVRNSSVVVPRAMMTALLLNGLLGLLSLITFCFTVGDADALLSTGTSPHTRMFFNATNSISAATAMSIILQILGIATNFINLTSASRLLFAFARDRGVPYASFISHVRPGWRIPLNAIIITFCMGILLGLLNIASSQLINPIYSIAVSGNFFSYIVSIGCVRLKRWRKEPLPDRRWSLGRWGAPVNDIAIIFLAFAFILFHLPGGVGLVPTTVDNMNFSSVIFGGTILLAMLFYYVKARHVYVNPASLVRKDL